MILVIIALAALLTGIGVDHTIAADNNNSICINLLYCGLPIMQDLCSNCDKDKPDSDIAAGLLIYDVKAKLVKNFNNPNNLTDIEISFRTNKPAAGSIGIQAGRTYSEKKSTYSTKYPRVLSTYHIVIITKQSNASIYNFITYARTQDEQAESARFITSTLRPYDSLLELVKKIIS